jgi:hypothetical protein
MFEASVWERLEPAADFRQEERVRRQEKQEIPTADFRREESVRRQEKQEIQVADFCPEESVRRQERQEIPVADDRPVFFLAKWVGREASQETFRDQFLSFLCTFSCTFLHSFWVGDNLLEKLSRTSTESIADLSPVLYKLSGTYSRYRYRKRLNWNIFI